jgi:hypothetical protein
MQLIGTATPTIALLRTDDGKFQARVTFPPGLWAGRRSLTGAPADTAADAVSGALVLSARVIAQIASPAAVPDVDADLVVPDSFDG